MRKLIDISLNQGNITDWNAIKSQGFGGAIVRVGYRGWGTVGAINLDSKFHTYMQEAQNAGLSLGAYIVTQAITEDEAREEARCLVEQCKQYKITEPLAIDVEAGGGANGQGRGDLISRDLRTAIINAFSDEIRILGYEPMCYANKNWFRNFINPDITCPAWVAHYKNEPNLDEQYTLDGYNVIGWQYGSDTVLEGIPDNTVDTNVFYNEPIQPIIEEVEQTDVQEENVAEIEPQASTDTYTVVSGDTLSGIASKFNTTYQELAEINGIADPNLIGIGQGIKLKREEIVENTENAYIVQSGDTLSEIASRFGTTYQILAEINGIPDPSLIHQGQIIKLNNSELVQEVAEVVQEVVQEQPCFEYTVEDGDNLYNIALKYLGNGMRYQEIKDLNGLDGDTIYPGQVLTIPQ